MGGWPAYTPVEGPSWAFDIAGMEDKAAEMDGDRAERYCRCGTRLARDNASALCAVCQRDAQQGNAQPPVVPPAFWETDQMRDALASRHLGRVIRAYRLHAYHGARALSQELVGSWAGLTQAQLSRIESGPEIRDLDRLTRWAELLGIPQRCLWFDLPGKSRELAIPAPVASVVFARAEPDREPLDDVAAMTAFRAADRQVGGGHLYSNVIRYLERSVAPRLFGGTGSSGSGVFSAAAALTEMAGWMAHDAGQDVRARQHFDRALALAGAGPDHELGAAILASQSHLAYEQRNMSDAVALAQQGQQRVREGPTSPVVLARLLAMEARGLAATGNREASSRALDQAERVLSHTTVTREPSVWASPFDVAALASEAAECWRQLGQFDEAERQVRRAVALRTGDRARSRALGRLKLTEIYVAQGRFDEACAVGREVLAATQGLSSVRVIRQLRDLHGLLSPLRSVGVVREFAGELAGALNEREWWYTWAGANVASDGEPER
jgi:tetratricopeptide (TPR) repeat protein/transcriptional regulator with XRE-family HTH domain